MENSLSTKQIVLVISLVAIVFGVVSIVIVQAMITNSWYLQGFSVINKEVVVTPDNFWVFQHSVTEYRVFYGNGTGDYVLTTEAAFNNSTIGAWFTGPFIMIG